MQRVIQSGELLRWELRFATAAGSYVAGARTLDQSYTLTAVAKLADGKNIRSEPFVIQPDELRGPDGPL